ncbi:MAG: hypothetical protein O3B22_17535 [Proteobacteria bacterium]|nr:hypothetical protein [Pseudomonadota bacterium]MDA1174638.1 hypothetical protein [Chloroflexota bacterium]
MIYSASKIKRHRATALEMEERAQFLIDYATKHGPCTVRQLYYAAEVHGLLGIEKTDSSYNKVQYQVLKLRREGRLPYDVIADATRWMRKPRSYDDIQDALDQTAALYRRNLWRDAEAYVEVWCEKDALAGVIYPITAAYDVPLMVARGFSSETFCYEAVAQRGGDPRPYHVLYLGDFDRAGQDAATSLHEKLARFAGDDELEIVFHEIAVRHEQIEAWGLPTRPPKRETVADRKWPHDVACELDAIPPDDLRWMVEKAINDYLPEEQLCVLKVAEESERELLQAFARRAA